MNECTLKDRTKIVECMDYLIRSLNNESAYYQNWIYLVPDEATVEDYADIAEDDELYGETCKLFRSLLKHYGPDGFYARDDSGVF